MKRILLILVIVSISCPSLAKNIINDEVLLDAIECISGHCIKLTYINHFERAVCIQNTSFPHDGNLDENVFRIINSDSDDLSRYQLIEPFLLPSKVALVRLIQAGGVATTMIDLSSFYDVKKGQTYRIECKR